MESKLNILNYSSIPFILVNRHKVIEVGDRFIDLIRYEKADIIGKDIQYVWKNLLRVEADFLELKQNHKSIFIFTRDIDPREVEVSIETLGDGTTQLIIFNEKLNSRLENKILFINKLFEDKETGIGIFSSPDLILLKANQTYLDCFGEPLNINNKAIGQSMDSFYPDWHKDCCEEKKILESVINEDKMITLHEVRQSIKPSEEKFYDKTIYHVDDPYGKGYFVYIIRDVTERVKCEKLIKRQAEQLIRIEKEKNDVLEKAMKMKDEFLATITHEFKTPLTVINAALQAIETIYGSQLSDNIRRHLQRIRTNSFRQLRLVNNLLDITRYNTGHLKLNQENLDIVFLTNAILKSVDTYAKQKGVNLQFSSKIKFKEIAIDEEKYERILLNLLSNAIKFTPKGKTVYVDIECIKGKAVISVKDEGIGIPKSKQKVIFERFGQVDSSLSRQAEGTGIGLSLVKTLVEGINGTISLSSELNTGSLFKITIPITKVRSKRKKTDMEGLQDHRITHAAAIEFSDIYIEG